MPGNGPSDPNREPAKNRDDSAAWSAQLNQSFLFSPYWGPSDKEPFTASSIGRPAESAAALLTDLTSDSPGRAEKARSFVALHAETIVATVLELSMDPEKIAGSVATAALRTQRRLAEFGEIGKEEIERATMVVPPRAIEPVLGGTAAAFVTLSVGDASAALAAQRAGLDADFGRAVFAAELILELRDVLHARLA